MTPYYQRGSVVLYHADSREIIHNFDGRTVVSDPPYNRNYHYKTYRDNLALEEYHKLLRVTLRVPSVVLHYAEPLFELARILGTTPLKVVPWLYNANTPRQWRAIAWFGTNEPDFSRMGQPYKNPKDKRIQALVAQGKEAKLYDWWEVQQVKNVSAEKTAHPCQIPLEVMMRILGITPDVPILDPFAGSGTTLLAALSMSRDAVGIEIDEAYCEIIAKRLEAFKDEQATSPSNLT